MKSTRVTLGAFALAATLVMAPATSASADVAGPYSTLKECEKSRKKLDLMPGYVVGPCQKATTPGFYRFLYERI